MKEVLCFRTTHIYILYSVAHLCFWCLLWRITKATPKRNYELNFATHGLCHPRQMPLSHCFTCTILTKSL